MNRLITTGLASLAVFAMPFAASAATMQPAKAHHHHRHHHHHHAKHASTVASTPATK